MNGLNLLAAIVIYWITGHIGKAVRHRKLDGLTVEPELLAHISPFGWACILPPANTGGQSVDSGLSVRFCPLPKSSTLLSSSPQHKSVAFQKRLPLLSLTPLASSRAKS